MSNPHQSSQKSSTLKRDRSRSRSPNQKIDEARRDRMARLRADDGDDDDDIDNENNDGIHNRRKKSTSISTLTTTKEDDHTINDDDEDIAMAQLMGFSGFASTKGELVPDNQKGAARGAATKNKARKYRQYMNRKGGFNRALDKMP